MSNANSIFEIKDYGKISFHIKEIMDEKKLTRSALARLADVHLVVSSKL